MEPTTGELLAIVAERITGIERETAQLKDMNKNQHNQIGQLRADYTRVRAKLNFFDGSKGIKEERDELRANLASERHALAQMTTANIDLAKQVENLTKTLGEADARNREPSNGRIIDDLSEKLTRANNALDATKGERKDNTERLMRIAMDLGWAGACGPGEAYAAFGFIERHAAASKKYGYECACPQAAEPPATPSWMEKMDANASTPYEALFPTLPASGHPNPSSEKPWGPASKTAEEHPGEFILSAEAIRHQARMDSSITRNMGPSSADPTPVRITRQSAQALVERSCSLLQGISVLEHLDDCTMCQCTRRDLNSSETVKGVAEVLRGWYSYASNVGSTATGDGER